MQGELGCRQTAGQAGGECVILALFVQQGIVREKSVTIYSLGMMCNLLTA